MLHRKFWHSSTLVREDDLGELVQVRCQVEEMKSIEGLPLPALAVRSISFLSFGACLCEMHDTGRLGALLLERNAHVRRDGRGLARCVGFFWGEDLLHSLVVDD